MALIPGEPGQEVLALLRPSGDLDFLNPVTGRLDDGPSGIEARAIAAGTRRLAWASAQGVTVLELPGDRVLGEVAGAATAVAVAPDGGWLACAYQDGRLALHDAREPGLALRGAADLSPARDFATVLHAAPDGHLLVGTRRGAVLRFEVRISK